MLKTKIGIECPKAFLSAAENEKRKFGNHRLQRDTVIHDLGLNRKYGNSQMKPINHIFHSALLSVARRRKIDFL